jgi:hypothetical protein
MKMKFDDPPEKGMKIIDQEERDGTEENEEEKLEKEMKIIKNELSGMGYFLGKKLNGSISEIEAEKNIKKDEKEEIISEVRKELRQAEKEKDLGKAEELKIKVGEIGKKTGELDKNIYFFGEVQQRLIELEGNIPKRIRKKLEKISGLEGEEKTKEIKKLSESYNESESLEKMGLDESIAEIEIEKREEVKNIKEKIKKLRSIKEQIKKIRNQEEIKQLKTEGKEIIKEVEELDISIKISQETQERLRKILKQGEIDEDIKTFERTKNFFEK